MNEPGAPPPPLMVLCGHRTGSSAFMGLLEAAGLQLGELLPASVANPRGYFENRAVVEANNSLLLDMGRDWTCPPVALDHRRVDLKRLSAAVAELRRSGGIWGFKDPRTLFTLPAWTAALGPVRLVGVHRNSHDVAVSLVARDGLPYASARAIADAYAERLAEAHKRLGFPIVGFDDPDEFLARTGRVAAALRLDWGSVDPESLFDPHLVHHQPDDSEPGPIDRYLAEAVRYPIEAVPVSSAGSLVGSWETLRSDAVAALPTDLGPSERLRRTDLIEWSRRSLPANRIVLLTRANSTANYRGVDVTVVSPAFEVRSGEPIGEGETWSHVVGSSLLDHIAPRDLGGFLTDVARRLEPRAVIAVSGWILHDEDLPPRCFFDGSGVTARRDEYPFLHHIDEIAATVLGTHLHLAAVDRTGEGRTRLLITNDRSLATRAITRPQLQIALDEALSLVKERGAALEQLRDAVSREQVQREAAVSREQRQREAAESRAGEAESRLDAAIDRADSAATQAAQLEADTTRLAARLDDAEKRAREARRNYERLAKRRIVRLALALARPMRPLFGAWRRLRRRPRPESALVPGPRARMRRSREKVVAGIKSVRPRVYPRSGPLVSVIILTRDGAAHLERLLTSLRETSYRSFEVVIVDNASTDDTGVVLERDWSFPVKVVSNDENVSFSMGNNQGFDAGSGELVLFLNNDVEPITDEWLGAMVAAMELPTHPSAVGALLVYPERSDPETDFTVQHRGIGFGFRDGAPHAVNLPADDPTDPSLADAWEVPAVTAAAMLTRRDVFDSIGRFALGYFYGAEDVDLCLRLRREGPIVLQGDAVLFHHESATQSTLDRDSVRSSRSRNWQRFAETWGPALRRSVLRDRLRGGGKWTGRTGRSAAITLTRDDPRRGYGDYYTAHELGDALEAQGWSVHYVERYRDQWYDLPDDLDLLVVLIDAFDVGRVPKGVFTVAWVRNWVERWLERPWLDTYDLVLAGSASAAESIKRQTRFDPPVVPLATNPTRFSPGLSVPALESDYVFTGNNWGEPRSLIDVLDVREGEVFLLFGARWDQVPQLRRFWRGFVQYEALPEVYRSTKVVLDDTAGPTIEHGFVNSRVFDALASGALVLSNNEIGSSEVFGGLLPVYGDRASLRRLLDQYLGDDQQRNELVDQLGGVVEAEHTYERRARQLLDLGEAAIGRPRVAVKIGAPDSDRKHQWGDFHFATSLVRSLRTHGFAGRVDLLPDWDAPDRQDADVVIHLRGLSVYEPKPSAINVMWLISHPDEVTPEECDRYDLVCVASKSLAEELRHVMETPVLYLPQATDASRFGQAKRDASLATEVLFVGNSRNQDRPVVRWAVENRLPLSVYGDGWEGRIPRRYWKGQYFPNERLPDLYASAAIVLNDHWPDMRREGIVSNRVLDALAAGALVLSDPVAGLDDLVGDAVPTFSSPEELARLVHEVLADPDVRHERVDKGRRCVLDRHTFAERAATLVEAIKPLLAGRSSDCEGSRLDLESWAGHGGHPRALDSP